MRPLNLAFFASHGGSNMQAILDACSAGEINAVPRVLISNNRNAFALERAKQCGIKHYCVNKNSSASLEESEQILGILSRSEIDLMVLAGYMRKIQKEVLQAYEGRIINIHPSLLPKFGGKGMYGIAVHEAVLAAGESKTGATVHLVTENYDEGPILAQREVAVLKSDSAETLRARVLKAEHELYVQVIGQIAGAEISLPIRH